MARMDIIGARVTPEMKARFRALAEHEQISESALLKRMIDGVLLGAGNLDLHSDRAGRRRPRVHRFSIRLLPDDYSLLAARADARRMPAASYASVLLRAHLRSLTPLPKDELVALKRSVAELGAIGRNLNQIARAAHRGEPAVSPGREEVRTMLRVCEGLRDHVKALIRANVSSWRTGHAETSD